MTQIQTAIGDKCGAIIQALSTLFGGVVIALIFGWKLALVVLALSPAIMIIGALSGRVMAGLTNKERSAYSKAGTVAEEAISSIRTVVAFGGENDEMQRYNANLEKAESVGIKKAITSGVSMGIFFIVMSCTQALSFWYGTRLIANEEMKGGHLLTARNLFLRILLFIHGGNTVEDKQSLKICISQHTGWICTTWSSWSNIEAFAAARGAAYFVYEVIEREYLNGDVSFSNVYFNYPTRPHVSVLQGLNLNVNSGQKVALVGASGCGKSTSVGLLERFYNPKSGDIGIDNEDISGYNLKWLRSQISIVSQEPVLFAKSIKGNITYGMISKNDEPISQKVIEKAARAANIHDFIISLPHGYDTMVGEKGTLISGGQKQRIAIARALIRNPRILLLDEATSALDSESEKLVQEALDRAMENRTSIIIAHRLSTVQNADVIAIIQGGCVSLRWEAIKNFYRNEALISCCMQLKQHQQM